MQKSNISIDFTDVIILGFFVCAGIVATMIMLDSGINKFALGTLIFGLLGAAIYIKRLISPRPQVVISDASKFTRTMNNWRGLGALMAIIATPIIIFAAAIIFANKPDSNPEGVEGLVSGLGLMLLLVGFIPMSISIASFVMAAKMRQTLDKTSAANQHSLPRQ